MIPGLGTGNFSSVRSAHGALIEFSNAATPLMLQFEFNPTTVSRSRSITVSTGGAQGTRGGYDFTDAREAGRAAQGVVVNAESISMRILLDATDRMNAGDVNATLQGVQPELDTLRSMIEPQNQVPAGARTLAALGQGQQRAFARDEYASVLVFVWGVQLLPVFLTQVQIDAKEYLPSLLPYRAEVALTLQLIESNNPFYLAELKRQFANAVTGSALGALRASVFA